MLSCERMFSRQHRKARVLFAVSDILLTTLAFEAAYQIRVWMPHQREFFLTRPDKALILGFALVVCVVIAYWMGIYDKLHSCDPRVVLSTTFRQCLYGAAALVILEFALRQELSRFFLGMFYVLEFSMLFLFRMTAGRVVGAAGREFAGPHYVMVVGTGERARQLGGQLERNGHYGIRLRGFLADAATSPASIELDADYPVHPLSALPQLLRQNVIDEIIFAVGSENLAGMEEAFLLCDEEGVRTRVAVDFFPHVNSDIYLERLGFTPLLTFSAAPHDEIRLLVKRLLDIAGAAAGLLVLLPFMVAIVIAVRMTSRGPAVFRQVRCGLNGRRFMFYKFRSMCDNAEAMQAGLMHLSKKTTAFKIPDDPRLTPIGRLLRKFSIDEWPQLWNVLKGDMSLVGPRPAIPSEVEQYQRWQRRRLRMRPGLTCLWAIAGRDNLDFETWMKMDMQYIDTWSLALDCKIILRTIPRVLTGKGAN